MATAEIKRARAYRQRQGYDPNPPLCQNCTRFVKSIGGSGVPYQPPFCSATGLNVTKTAVCDYWQGHNGEQLLKE